MQIHLAPEKTTKLLFQVGLKQTMQRHAKKNGVIFDWREGHQEDFPGAHHNDGVGWRAADILVDGPRWCAQSHQRCRGLSLEGWIPSGHIFFCWARGSSISLSQNATLHLGSPATKRQEGEQKLMHFLHCIFFALRTSGHKLEQFSVVQGVKSVCGQIKDFLKSGPSH